MSASPSLRNRIAQLHLVPACEKSPASVVSNRMSTLAEIQDAVAQLPGNERKALQLWLNSQAEPEMTAQEEQRLLRSLDEAIREIDSGKGVSTEEVRKRVGSWAAR